MTEDEHGGDGKGGAEGGAGGGEPGAPSIDESGAVPASTPAAVASAGREISAKLELMGAVALLSVTAAVRMLEMKGRQLGPEQREELAEVRRKLRTSMAALDEHAEAGSLPGVDLSGLRNKVAQALATLDRSTALLEDPPS